jgi:rhamnose utilization protein RhaD (predicted bifunctional aldolase and dehydrogenase)
MRPALQEKLKALLRLSHELGREDRGMAILGEGNSSARVSDDTFLIKASGSRLGVLRAQDLVECNAGMLLPLLDRNRAADEEIETALSACRVNPRSKKPSIETLFHAFCLTLPGADFVGHTHAVAVSQIVCSPLASVFAGKRIFPDEIVCCGEASVLVPYTDPGLPLARMIRRRVNLFLKQYKQAPRVILLENHGIITLGRTPESVLAAMLMAEKAARIWVGAASLGGPRCLSRQHVHRIASRSDEECRRRAMNL